MAFSKKSDTRVIVEEIVDETNKDTPVKVKEDAPESSSPLVKTEDTKESPDIDQSTKELPKEKINADKKEPPKETAKVARDVSGSRFNIFWIILPGIVLLGLLMGGVFAYYSGINKLKNNDKTTTAIPATEVNLPEASPTPSPSPEVDLTKYEIKILNGSGIPGEAGKARALLEEAGYIIKSTGNAAKYNYGETIIQAKATVDKNFVDQLEKDLSQTYVLRDNEVLSTPETSSVIVIIGSSKSN